MDVGGSDSQFLATLRKRMLEAGLPVPQSLWHDLQLSIAEVLDADTEINIVEQT